MNVRHCLFIAAFGVLTASAFAQAPGGGPPAGGGPSPEMRAAFEAVNRSCAEDRTKLCDGKPGREGMMCLRANQDKVSAPCKDAMAKMPAPPAGGPPRN
jgi:hypothetical protein